MVPAMQEAEWKCRIALDDDELRRHANLIDLYLSRNQLPLALGIMREWVVSLLLARIGRRPEWLDGSWGGNRSVAERRLGALAALQRDKSGRDASGIVLTEEQKKWAVFWNQLTDLRNELHHHGMKKKPVRYNPPELQKVKDFWSKLKDLQLTVPEFGGGHGRLLITALGTTPGVLYSALSNAGELVRCLIICSEQSRPSIAEAANRAGFQGEYKALVITDPHGGYAEDEQQRFRAEASRWLLDTPLDVSEQVDDRVRAELGVALLNLYEQVSGRPSSFYAMLLLDGDSMGRLLLEARASLGDEGEQQVTRALGLFAHKVSPTVSGYDGVTVYCGGDDVFAMLPVGQALPCALALSKLYRDCFAQACQKTFAGQATISAGIVYCPFRAPLREVSATAHHLLDHLAKDQTGRNSLAVAVLKSSGIACQWSAPWDHVQENNATILDRLVECLGGSGDRPGELSSGFLFQIRERYALLTNDPLTTPGRFGQLPEGVDVHPILLAEYLRGRSRQGEVEEGANSEPTRKASETIELLLKVCRRVHRTEGMDEKTLGMDGALLVRFLTGESREVGP